MSKKTRAKAEQIVRDHLDQGLAWDRYDSSEFPDAVLQEAEDILSSLYFIVGYVR